MSRNFYRVILLVCDCYGLGHNETVNTFYITQLKCIKLLINANVTVIVTTMREYAKMSPTELDSIINAKYLENLKKNRMFNYG